MRNLSEVHNPEFFVRSVDVSTSATFDFIVRITDCVVFIIIVMDTLLKFKILSECPRFETL